MFAEEMVAAGVPVSDQGQSLFGGESPSDLSIGVIVTDMKGRFLRGCGWSTPEMSWTGDSVLETHWEIYSQLQAKVVGAFDTSGGFAAPKGGLAGDPERLIYEALRDNLRRLIASETFRRAVAVPPATQPNPQVSAISFASPTPGKVAPAAAVRSAVSIFAGSAMGSGVLISPDGYILTNQHVAGDTGRVRVRWSDGSETVGDVMRSDRKRDVALVKVTPTMTPALAIRHTEVENGETVFAIGTPLDKSLSGTLTRGVVSARRIRDGLPYIQSDVAVTHGNSGGPLLDDKGSVVGLTVSGLEPDGAPVGLNFFIPIDDALKALAIVPAG